MSPGRFCHGLVLCGRAPPHPRVCSFSGAQSGHAVQNLEESGELPRPSAARAKVKIGASFLARCRWSRRVEKGRRVAEAAAVTIPVATVLFSLEKCFPTSETGTLIAVAPSAVPTIIPKLI